MDGALLADRIKQTQEAIAEAARRSQRSPQKVRLVAVSKTQPAEAIKHAAALGLRSFGENYVQEAMAKFVELAPLNLEWHFIGALQSNKAKLVVGRVALIHSLDRLSLGEEISRRAVSRRQPVLIEVNVAGEASKDGVAPKDAPALLDKLAELPGLEIQGLMVMPPLASRPEESRPHFARARQLHEQWAAKFVGTPHPWNELSMGTTHDFAIAIEEGATIVRVGTAIFGSRSG